MKRDCAALITKSFNLTLSRRCTGEGFTFFVRAHSTVEIDMPAENLELRYAYGSAWYGEKNLFGEYTRYTKDEEYYDFSRYTLEISLYTSNAIGQTVDVEYIDADEF